MKIWIIVGICLAGGALALFGNHWHPLPLSTLRYESTGSPPTGKVSVEIEQDEKGAVLQARIFAYEREFLIPKDKLSSASFRERWYQITVSADSGIFGSTLYVGLRSISEDATLTVTSKGRIEVSRRKRNA